MTLKQIKQTLTNDINQPLITGFQKASSHSQVLGAICKPASDNYLKEIKMTQPAKKRLKPYIWVTWLASLMGEEKQCKYTAWFSAHYQFERDSNYDSCTHDEMVSQLAIQHKAQGFVVYVEDNNSFTINGKTCDIGGKLDILVKVEGGQPIIIDCKLGKRKAAHRMQVLIYMLLFPLAPNGKRLCQGQTPAGRLVYPDGIVEIPSSEVDEQFKEFFRQTVAIISSPSPPSQAPSRWECRYCNIPGAYCPARIDPKADTGEHNLF